MSGAYCSNAGPLINTAAAPTSIGDQPLSTCRRSTAAPAGLHQHDADRRLSRRRPAERRPISGAAGRRGGRAHRHRPHPAAPAQPDAQGRVPATRRRPAHTYDSGDPARLLDRCLKARGLERLQEAPRGSQETRQAARHRAAPSSSSRPAASARRRSPSASTPMACRSSSRWRARQARATRPCSPTWSRRSSACTQDKIALRDSDPAAHRSSAPARSVRAR